MSDRQQGRNPLFSRIANSRFIVTGAVAGALFVIGGVVGIVGIVGDVGNVFGGIAGVDNAARLLIVVGLVVVVGLTFGGLFIVTDVGVGVCVGVVVGAGLVVIGSEVIIVGLVGGCIALLVANVAGVVVTWRGGSSASGLTLRQAANMLPAFAREHYLEEWRAWLSDLRDAGVPWYRRLAEWLSIVLIGMPRLAVMLRLGSRRTVDS